MPTATVAALAIIQTGSPFCAYANERYTAGDCWMLALAIHEATGWDVVAVGAWSEYQDVPKFLWWHIAVSTPEGLILDANGLQEQGDWMETWAEYGDPESTEFYATYDSGAIATLVEGQEALYAESTPEKVRLDAHVLLFSEGLACTNDVSDLATAAEQERYYRSMVAAIAA